MLRATVSIVPTKPIRKVVVGEDTSNTRNIESNGTNVIVVNNGNGATSDHMIIFVISIKPSN